MAERESLELGLKQRLTIPNDRIAAYAAERTSERFFQRVTLSLVGQPPYSNAIGSDAYRTLLRTHNSR